jgi:hypothetical protein
VPDRRAGRRVADHVVHEYRHGAAVAVEQPVCAPNAAVAGVPDAEVPPRAAVEAVVRLPVAHADEVASGTALHHVATCDIDEDVVAGSSREQVVPRAPADDVAPAGSQDAIVAACPDERARAFGPAAGYRSIKRKEAQASVAHPSAHCSRRRGGRPHGRATEPEDKRCKDGAPRHGPRPSVVKACDGRYSSLRPGPPNA